MSRADDYRTIPRTFRAQDRIDKLRETLGPRKRKIEENTEKKIIDEQSALKPASSANVILPNVNRLPEHVAKGKRPTDSNLDKQAITRKKSLQPKSPLDRSDDSIHTFVEDSNRRIGKRKKPKPHALDTEYPSSNELPSPKYRRRRKNPIGPQRLANARESLLEKIRKNGETAYHPGIEQESASTVAKFPVNVSPCIETKSQQAVAGECTYAFTKLEPRVNTFVDRLSLECDMDVDMDMDADFDSPFPSTVDSSNSLMSIPEEWLEKKKEEQISSTMNEIDCIRKDRAYLALHESYISDDVEMNLSTPSGDLLIVVDTNIFLSHLRFVQRLVKFGVSSYKAHVLVVPWVVIQEIDFAKKKPNKDLANQARLSIRFIFECLKKKDSRFFGQSFEDFKVIYKNVCSVDDFLLQYCLSLISLRNNVVFLSDDKNLCNKCMFSHVPAYTKCDFERTFDLNL